MHISSVVMVKICSHCVIVYLGHGIEQLIHFINEKMAAQNLIWRRKTKCKELSHLGLRFAFASKQNKK